MGLWDFFRRPSSETLAEESSLDIHFDEAGLLLSFAVQPNVEDIDSLLDFGDAQTTEDALLRSYLSQLHVEGLASFSKGGIHIKWAAVYEVIGSESHKELLPFLKIPSLLLAVPRLANVGAVSDINFEVRIEGWVLDAAVIHVERIIGPVVSFSNSLFIVSDVVYKLLQAIEALNAIPDDGVQEEREREWGKVRALAIQADAVFASKYLSSTIVLTPEKLRLPMHREDTTLGRVYTISPTFQNAPDGWIDQFDRFRQVQPHYDISEGGNRIRVIVEEPVRKVLETIKREMPARKIAGANAENFIKNPRAYLGEFAEAVIDPAQYEADQAAAGFITTTFHLQPILQNGQIISAKLSINEFYPDGHSATFNVSFESPDKLRKLTAKIGDALSDGRPIVMYEEFDLMLEANSEDKLQRMLEVLNLWERQANAGISLEDIYELSGYSQRIEGIGAAKPVYIPVLQREKKEDGEYGWLPAELTPLLKVMLPGADGPVLISLEEEWLANFQEKINEAERQGSATVADATMPAPIDVAHAKALVSGFHQLLTASEPEEPNASSRGGTQRQQVRTPKETLLVKSNFNAIDYAEARRKSLTPPAHATPRLTSYLLADIQLKPHQLEGVAWFQHLYSKAPDEVRGGLLADDMGLGKTLQLLCVLGKAYEDQPDLPPTLILVPKSLLANWRNEVGRFFSPEFPKVLTLYGPELEVRRQPRHLIDAALREKGIADLLAPHWLGAAKVVITTYDVLLSFEFSLAKQDFEFVICDEAQRIKNPAAKISTAARALKSKFKVACTGTPVENSLVDLWCLFDFFQPGLLGSLEQFHKMYRRPIECQTEEQRKALHDLQALIKPQTLRRTKQDIAADLPRKYFVVTDSAGAEQAKNQIDSQDLLKIDLCAHQRVLYKTGLKRLRDARQEKDGRQRGRLSFEALHFMKAVCAEPYCLPGRKFLPDPKGILEHLQNSPKLAWLLGRLQKIREDREKAIIFTEIREIQTALQYFLSDRFKLKPYVINGDSENRQSIIDKFTAKEGFDVIILSPLAAGAGLNVVAANHVFHFTRAWNPAKEAQATDRAYRIGQAKDVMVYCPTMVDADDQSYVTFEERLDRLLKEKEALARNAMDGDALISMLNGAPGDVSFRDFVDVAAPAAQSVSRVLTMDDVDRLDGDAFEVFCALLFSKRGFVAQVTKKRGGDGGIDVVALQNDKGVLVQCKSSQSESLGWDAIKEVVAGSLAYQRRFPKVEFSKVAFTNRKFNEAAREQAAINNVLLITRDDIVQFIGELSITDVELDEHLLAA